MRGVGGALAAFPLGRLLAACGASNGAVSGDGGAESSAGGGASADGAASGDGAAGWATGGTAAMTDKANYPNPFAGDSPTACALTCEMTQGPCYSSQSETIRDISYGYGGLPVRMALRVLDESCNPVAGAVVDVWHVSPVGKYSGDDASNENVAFCTGNDSDFTSHLYFRGKQTTGSDGVASFDTCFPGWYSGRTVHVHITVRIGDAAYLTTQLFFEDTLDDEIIATQPLYDTRGARDTTNQTDTVISASAVSQYLFQTSRMTDGAMLAWKTLIVRGADSSASCSVPGGSGAPSGERG